jgi:hypothetical protein
MTHQHNHKWHSHFGRLLYLTHNSLVATCWLLTARVPRCGATGHYINGTNQTVTPCCWCCWCCWCCCCQVIEAHYLYGVDYDDIEIVIHPQSIIHSMIETADSSVLAQVRGSWQCRRRGGCAGGGVFVATGV